jgi:hypothetical protein
MVALNEKRYVVVTHGTDGGIALPIIAKTRVIPQDDDLEALVTLADERKRTLDNNEKIDSDWLKNEIIHRWQITGMPIITEADMLQLADDVLAVRKLKLDQLEIRGCHAGRLPRILRLLRDLFGAQSISAPVVDMFFIDIRPAFGPNSVQQLRVQPVPANARRRIFHDLFGNNGDLVIEMTQLGPDRYRARAAINSRAEIPGWATALIPGFAENGQPTFILEGMWDNSGSFAVPREDAYSNLLRVAP